MNEEELRDLWRLDPEEDDVTVDMTAIRQAALDFDRTIARRNLREVFAGGVVVAAFAAMAVTAGAVPQAVGFALIAVGGAVVTYNMVRLGTLAEADPSSATGDYLQTLEANYRYQADLLRRVPVWYVGPLVPGYAVHVGVRLWETWGSGLVDTLMLAGVPTVVGLLVGAGVIWLNRRAATELDAKADALH